MQCGQFSMNALWPKKSLCKILASFSQVSWALNSAMGCAEEVLPMRTGYDEISKKKLKNQYLAKGSIEVSRASRMMFFKTTFPQIPGQANITGSGAWGTLYKNIIYVAWALRWRHNERDGVSNHQPHDCLLNRLFRRRSKETSKLRVTGLCEKNSPVAGEFPAQKATNAGMFPFDDVIMATLRDDYCRRRIRDTSSRSDDNHPNWIHWMRIQLYLDKTNCFHKSYLKCHLLNLLSSHCSQWKLSPTEC